MLSELHKPARYRAELERLHARRDPRRLFEVTQGGVSLARLIHDKAAVARHLARDVANGTFEFQPATLREVLLDKQRILFRFGAVDLVVHGVVAQLLTELMEPRLSPHLYSYRRGRSAWLALRRCAAYVRAHRRRHRLPLTRGLYVVRADVEAYGDSIPFHAGSAIWDQIATLCEVSASHRESPAWKLVERAVRVEVQADHGRATTSVGVPTGSPIATAIANLYLTPLDHALGDDPDVLYARYGDDIIIAHEQLAVVQQAERRARTLLAARGLRFNEAKYRSVFFNGAGRRSPHTDAISGTTVVDYLGVRLSFDGTLSLTRSKQRDLLGDVRRRVVRASAMLGPEPADGRGRALCACVSAMLDPSSPVAVRYADLLAQAVTDRKQLAQLDYWIARAVAEALTGRRGARAFRHVSYRQLRDWGLPSTVLARNGQGRR